LNRNALDTAREDPNPKTTKIFLEKFPLSIYAKQAKKQLVNTAEYALLHERYKCSMFKTVTNFVYI